MFNFNEERQVWSRASEVVGLADVEVPVFSNCARRNKKVPELGKFGKWILRIRAPRNYGRQRRARTC